MYIALQVLIGMIALVLLFFLLKTLWVFSIRLKEKYYLLGLIWQGAWIVVGLGAVLMASTVVRENQDRREYQAKQQRIKEACETMPGATPDEIKAEYQRQMNRGYRPIPAVYRMAKQKNRIGRDIFCLMEVDGVTAMELAEALEQE